MGLAASQARYLALSARKTNVEYEGQQINQQRLTLSNQSADLFNQMLTMEVPVCPDSGKFSKLQYSWSDGNNTSVLEDYYRLGEANSDYNYVVTSYHYEKKYVGQRKSLNDPQVQATKTNNFAVKTTTGTVKEKIYDPNKDVYTLVLNQSGQDVKYTFKPSEQNSKADVREQIDAMYGKTTKGAITGWSYDATNDTWANGAATYRKVDTTNETQLKKLKDSYGALYDSSKTYYVDNTTDPPQYICGDEIKKAQNSGAQVTVRKFDDNKYYTDGKQYLSSKELADLTVDKTANMQSATNDPTFSNYTAIGNCAVEEIIEDDYNKSPTMSVELKQILKDMKAEGETTPSYEHLSACFNANGDYTGGIYKFKMDGKVYYTTAQDMDQSLKSAFGKTATAENGIDNQQEKLAYYNAIYQEQKVNEVKNALLETDGQGRFSTVKFEDDSVVYTLNVETIIDEDAYNDAMNKYYYKQEQYDKQISDINAKTEILQAQDRKLQLQLEQLNTEQSALQTEMEACQKVVSKNVENSFKTFSG